MRGRYTPFPATRKAARVLRLARPSTMRSLAREALWSVQRRQQPPQPATWPADRALADELKIVWIDRYDWPSAAAWLEPLRLGLNRLVNVRRAPTAHVRNAVTFLVEHRNNTLAVAVEYGDSTAIDPELIAQHDLIFKMQYATGGYGTERVVPGGYVPNSMSLYRYLPHLRHLKEASTPTADVFGRFSGEKSGALRRRAVEILRSQQEVRFRGGLTPVRYVAGLAEAARSTVCLDLPGFGPLCFRLVDYFGIGSCVVGPPHGVDLHVPLEDGRDIVYCAPDLSDLVETAAKLVRDPTKASKVAKSARLYFDRYLDYRQLGGYYLATIAARL
jgi:hypothetical protein